MTSHLAMLAMMAAAAITGAITSAIISKTSLSVSLKIRLLFFDTDERSPTSQDLGERRVLIKAPCQ